MVGIPQIGLNKKKIIQALNFLVGIVLITVLVTKLDKENLWAALLGMNYLHFALALMLMFAVQVVQALRLYILVEGYEVQLKQIIWLYLVSLFFNNFLPGGIGGDSLKVYYLHKAEKKLGKAVTLTLVDRLVGLFSLTFFISLFFVVEWQHMESLNALIIKLLKEYGLPLLGLILLGGILLFLGKNWLKRFVEKLSKFFYDSKMALIGIRRILFWKITLLALLAHLLRGLAFLLILSGLGDEGLSFIEMMFIIAVAAWAVILPISVGGLGVREGIFSSLAFKFGVPLPTAIALSILTRFLLWIMALIGGVYFFLYKEELLPPENK